MKLEENGRKQNIIILFAKDKVLEKSKSSTHGKKHMTFVEIVANRGELVV